LKNLIDNSAITRLQAIVCVVIITASIAVAVYFGVSQNSPNKYEKSIIRNTDTAEEENALQAAENINYTDIFKIGRLTGAGLSNSNISDYSQYTYANFIDAEVLNYYEARYESLKGKLWGLSFYYSADVYAWDKIQAVYVTPPTMYPDTVRISGSNGTILNEYCGYECRYAYGNNSGIQEIQVSAIDFEFSNCYIVEMRLDYSEAPGNLSGFHCIVYQTVIVDGNLKPLLICVQPEQAIS
jgi:hypothetical protein